MLSERKTEKKRKGLRQTEVNLLRSNAVDGDCPEGATADQKPALPAVFLKAMVKDGNQVPGLAWHTHRWALRETEEL